LSDFGIARDVQDMSRLTATNMTVGRFGFRCHCTHGETVRRTVRFLAGVLLPHQAQDANPYYRDRPADASHRQRHHATTRLLCLTQSA
jgi:hypothetical protein